LNKIAIKAVIFSAAVLLFFCNCFTAFAEVTLPEGTAAGLPEKLTVLDSDGNSVNQSGEYFFYVENMTPKETYSKDIQIINLREDTAYTIYFYAEPVSKEGDIDLENNCTAVFTLDGTEIFTGKVTGQSEDNKINISDEPLSLGSFEPGKSRTLNCQVTWDGTGADEFIDNGERTVSRDGVEINREGNGNSYSYGEVTFRWVFYAVVDDEYVPPKTGVLSSENMAYLILLAVTALLVIIMLLLIIRKKKKRKQT
jgi:hypothetical protein